MNTTAIEWTDFSANPIKYRDASGKVVWACVHASPGCQHCYAETLAKRYGKGGPFNVPTTAKLTPFLDDKEIRAMLTSMAISGKRVFVGDMTDIFGEWGDEELLDQLFAVLALRGSVTWQLLTKRADRLRAYVSASDRQGRIIRAAIRIAGDIDGRPEGGLLQDAFELEELWAKGRFWPLPNVWLGVSAEDQQRADERIPLLLQTPAVVRFISAEPLLSKVDLTQFLWTIPGARLNHLHWIIAGGESGAGARRCDAAWVRWLVKQGKSADVPVFVKQLGSVVIDRNDAGFDAGSHTWADGPGVGLPVNPSEWPEPRDVEHDLGGTRDGYQGAPVRVHLKSRKGGDPLEWPCDLRVRQWPLTPPANTGETD